MDGRQLIVNGEPFIVKGICYSPIPVNESVYFAPYGDYFTAEYSFIWLRDLPSSRRWVPTWCARTAGSRRTIIQRPLTPSTTTAST